MAYYTNLPPPSPPPGRPPAHLPQPTLKNPEPDIHLFFHQHPKTGQMAISPFREEPNWSLIASKLKTDGTALVCTPDMLYYPKPSEQQQYYQPQSAPPPFSMPQYGYRMPTNTNNYRPQKPNYNYADMRQFRPLHKDTRFFLNKN